LTAKPFSRNAATTQRKSNERKTLSGEPQRPVHSKQLLTHLRLTGCRLGLLINFGENLMKDGFKRVANGLEVV
jgi:hypothetical protein